MESFHVTLKKEEVYRIEYVTFEQVNLALFQYIEEWYNRKFLVALVITLPS